MDGNEPVRLEGTVIRSYPSGDSDLVIRILTRELGKIAVFAARARSSGKRRGTSLEVFDTGVFTIRERRGGLASLNNFKPTQSWRDLRENLNKLGVASVICESFDILIREEQSHSAENGDLYEILNLGMTAVNEAGELKEILKAGYVTLSSLLAVTGYQDSSKVAVPSAKNLLLLIDHLERCAEKQLLSKGALQSSLAELKKNPDSPEQSRPDRSEEEED